MHIISLARAGLSHKPLHTSLSILATAMGIAMLTAVFLISDGISSGLKRNSGGIDVVAGAKGSPLQLILSSIYHTDVPIGNIDMAEYEEWKESPMVKSAIPLAMGDNYNGFRIIGTTADYLDIYHATPSEGRIFDKPFEVVAGSSTKMKIGDEFSARHGLAADSDDIHEDEKFTVVGLLKPTGTVIDKLLVTPLSSVQDAHAHHHEADEEKEEDRHHHHDEDENADGESESMERQMTAILIKAKNGASLMNLPRMINKDGHLQAANPAFELARLSKSFGIGRDVINTLGLSILALSTLMLFSTLASSLTERRHDMAVLRVLGASPAKLFATLMTEGVMVAGTGAIIGIGAGHILAWSLTGLLGSFEGIILKEELLSLHTSDILLLSTGIICGIVAALPAAISAARTDIARLLVKG